MSEQTTEYNEYSEEQLYHLIARTLMPSLPENWQTVSLHFEFIDEDVYERSATVDTGDGTEISISLRRSGIEMYDAFIEIARRMEEAGHGKWQSAIFTMDRNGKFNINFTYPE